MNAKPWPTVASGTSRAPTASEHPKNRARSISQRVTGTKEEPRLREEMHIGVLVPVRNSFGVCFHGLGRFLNGGVFRVGFCAEPCAGARTQTLRGACLSVGSACGGKHGHDIPCPYARFRGLIVARAVRQIIGRRRAVDYVLRSRGFEPAALGVHQGRGRDGRARCGRQSGIP
jgi:hypothetical protein